MVITNLLLISMKKNGYYVILNKLVFVLLLLLLYCNSCYVQCNGDSDRQTLTHPPTTTSPNHHHNNNNNRITSSVPNKRGVILLSILLGSMTGLGAALVSAFLLRCIFTYINTLPILKGPVVFSPQISPKSLQSALLSLSNETDLINGGKYYNTQLDNGFTVAVKKLEPFETGSNTVKRRIQKELEILATLRHRHLMTLRAYVPASFNNNNNNNNNNNRFCLVYDYVSTGSLEDAMEKMRENNNNNEFHLGWDARLRIAVGIIKGLQYLHYTCSPPILHYNLKPSNVMLDADFEPRLGDSGLTKLFMHNFHGLSHYYYAPECFPNFSIYTEKSDIFSFGVILGILLTGRDPSDPLFAQATSGSRSRGDMGMWFRQLVESGDTREALDKSLLGEEMEEDEMLMAVRIAAVCLSDIPADRPSSDELVPMLTQLHSF